MHNSEHREKKSIFNNTIMKLNHVNLKNNTIECRRVLSVWGEMIMNEMTLIVW